MLKEALLIIICTFLLLSCVAPQKTLDNLPDTIPKEITPKRETFPPTTSPSTTPSPSPPSPSESDDIPASFFTCGNKVCEGGESYESCLQDCTQQDIVGTNPGNGACEPGEDANNAPKDCTVINPQCGNNVCDEEEDRLNCYYDCWNEGESSGDACSSNSDCGSRQRCRSGKCVTVECTSDYQCKGCSRCSDNQCVSCGYGVAGYCTC